MAVPAKHAGLARFRLVVVVASMGGLDPLIRLLERLPYWFAVPLLIVQHRGSAPPEQLQKLLQRRTMLSVVAATDGMVMRPRSAVLVPAGFVATVDRSLRVTLVEGPSGHSGDTTLASVAEAVGSSAIAVVLSGMQQDGAAGVRAIKSRGGRALAQDPRTAAAPSMPANAIATGCIDYVLEPRRLGQALVALAMAPGGAELLTVSPPHWATLDA